MCENIRTVSQDFYETGVNIFQSSMKDIENRIESKLSSSGFNELGSICVKCDYVNACKGGCPVARHKGGLMFDHPSVYCELYKTLIYRIHQFLESQMPDVTVRQIQSGS